MDFIDPPAIGRYMVLERLGAGAMGVVYLCQDPLLKRRVAVKIVQKTRSGSDLMVERFQREAEISAQLNHPNIIMVFDVGEDPEAGPFLTMEFVDGSSLSKRMEDGRLEPEVILDWLTQLGLALVAAERAGVVHRDIKPENILVSRTSQLKLTDFGLARDDASRLTQTGTMMGTPTHTAPELLSGARATPVTDRWAYAVLAFQMVLGTLPHPGDTLSAVLNHIAREQPALPGGTSPPVARVFLKALHKDPARRYESVLAFLTALADALGLKDKLVPRGLEAEPAAAPQPRAPSPMETEVFQLPEAKPKTTAPVKPTVAPLTRPPEALLKGAADKASAPRSAPPTPQPRSAPSRPPRNSSSQNLALASHPGLKAKPRSWQPTLTPVSSGRSGQVVMGGILLLGALGFFFYPRTLVIETNPPQARLTMDGKPLGQSPYTGTLTFGSHMMEIRLDGYDTVIREIRAGESPIALDLQPATSWVDILTAPAGASVAIGGRTVGISPCKGVPVPDQPASLVVSLRGYRRWEGIVGPGKRPPVPIKLQRD